MIIFPAGIDIDKQAHKIILDTIPDVEGWVLSLLREKAENHRPRILQEAVEFLLEKEIALPSTKDTIIDMYFAHPEYKDRAEREAKQDN